MSDSLPPRVSPACYLGDKGTVSLYDECGELQVVIGLEMQKSLRVISWSVQTVRLWVEYYCMSMI